MTLETVATIGSWRRDARLHNTGSIWRLTVDIHVQFVEFGDRLNDDATGTRAWRSDEITAFKENFATAVENAWSHKWLLGPAQSTRGVLCNELEVCRWAPRPVDVTLRIRDRDQHTPVNRVPEVARRFGGIAPIDVNPVHVIGVPSDFSAEEGGHLYLSVGDNVADASPDGNMQIASAHEVGHLLGIAHPGDQRLGSACAPSTSPYTPQPAECYQDGSGDSRMIMGGGMYVRQWDYNVFASVMNQSTWLYRSATVSTGNWRYGVSSTRPNRCSTHPHAGDHRQNPGGVREWDPPPRS